jgi:hypothetical protein
VSPSATVANQAGHGLGCCRVGRATPFPPRQLTVSENLVHADNLLLPIHYLDDEEDERLEGDAAATVGKCNDASAVPVLVDDDGEGEDRVRDEVG